MIRSLCFAILGLAALAAPAAAEELQPGQYRVVTTVTKAEIPGMPDDMNSGMVGRKNESNICVTAENIAKGPATMMGANGQCAFPEYSLGGGEIEMAGSCKGAMGGGETTMTGSGAYTPGSFVLTMRSRAEIPSGEMIMEWVTTGERLDDC